MKKPIFYRELAYGAGMLLLALGTALTAFGDLGLSQVVAPAYILYIKVSQSLPWFTFGMGELALQLFVLVLLVPVLRKFRSGWLLSFASAFLYGLVLDAFMALTELLPRLLWLRLGSFALGTLLCSLGIAFLFRTYLPPAAYELFVKEVATCFRLPVTRVKTVYDIVSCLVAVGMSFLLLGKLEGVGIGTLICAALNGLLIRLAGKGLDGMFTFTDRFPKRKFLKESEEPV